MVGKLLFSLIFICLIAEIAIFFLPYSLFDSYTRSENNEQSSTIAVLFHGYNESENGVDQETERRLNYAISMIGEDMHPTFLLVGGNSPQFERTGADLMSKYCRDLGISNKYIITDSISFDSKSNLRSIVALSNPEPKDTVTVVSSLFHLLRIKYTQNLLRDRIHFNPYEFDTSSPKITRYFFWKSIHYNFLIFLINKVLPNSVYESIVVWVRTNTKR